MSQSKKSILLVDSMALLFRGFYATAIGGPMMQTSSGLYTNGVYQYTRYLLDAVKRFKPTHVACTFDMGKGTFRNELFPAYKSNRGEPPMELIPQFNLIWEVAEAFDVPCFGVQGFEADDVIGTLAKQAGEAGMEAMIMTGDGDALQLINESTSVMMMRKGFGHYETFTLDNFKEKKGLDDPSQVIEMKALMGDASDFIPGCPGVGPKTAEKLIAQFGTVDRVFAGIDEVKGKLRDNLLTHRDQIYMSRDLATIRRDVPVQWNEAECLWQVDSNKIFAKFEELEFDSLKKLITA